MSPKSEDQWRAELTPEQKAELDYRRKVYEKTGMSMEDHQLVTEAVGGKENIEVMQPEVEQQHENNPAAAPDVHNELVENSIDDVGLTVFARRQSLLLMGRREHKGHLHPVARIDRLHQLRQQAVERGRQATG